MGDFSNTGPIINPLKRRRFSESIIIFLNVYFYLTSSLEKVNTC